MVQDLHLTITVYIFNTTVQFTLKCSSFVIYFRYVANVNLRCKLLTQSDVQSTNCDLSSSSKRLPLKSSFFTINKTYSVPTSAAKRQLKHCLEFLQRYILNVG